MKAYELFSLWTQFESMLESSLPDEKKYDMGREWIASLPPRLVCASSQLSYDVVREAMLGRLNDLKKDKHGSAEGKTEDSRRQEQSQGSVGRPKPSRKVVKDA